MKSIEVEVPVKEGIKLPLMEAFYTIQGEGYHKGTAAYFIRLAGCDVGCHWCDVKESWDANLHPVKSISEIIKDIPPQSEIVVITGGEPTMYDLRPLTKELIDNGKRIHLETSGAHALSGTWHWICLSPKKRKLPEAIYYELADELKIIIYNQHDFLFAEEHAAKVNKNCILYLQPEWSVREKMMPLIIDYVLKNPQWKVTLQTHKYLHVR